MSDAQQPPWTPQQPPPPYGYGPVARNSGKAVASLVLGIASIVLCGLFLGIPAMIVARGAKQDIRRSGGQVQGEGLATAGFWTGLVGTVWPLVFVLAVFLFGGAVSTSFQQTCTQVSPGQGTVTTSCS